MVNAIKTVGPDQHGEAKIRQFHRNVAMHLYKSVYAPIGNQSYLLYTAIQGNAFYLKSTQTSSHAVIKEGKKEGKKAVGADVLCRQRRELSWTVDPPPAGCMD